MSYWVLLQASIIMLVVFTRYIWVKVFKNGSGKICGRQPLKNLKWYGLPKQIIFHLKFFKGCLPQILLDPFVQFFSFGTVFSFYLIRLICGRSQSIPIIFKNDGTLPCKVNMKLTDPNQSFTLHQQMEQVKSSFTTLHRS